MKFSVGEGDNIISIDVIRRTAVLSRDCRHQRVVVDTTLSELKCDDCGQMLNPVQWIADAGHRWDMIKRLTADYNKARRMLDARHSTKCQHCGRMTRISAAKPVTPGVTPQEVQP